VQGQAMVVLVYGFGKLMRVDDVKDGVVVLSRYLRPSVSEEEGMLAPECDRHLEEQQAAGRSTVQ
jgi:hypothetical protein